MTLSTVLLAALGVTSAAWACSGPGAAETIARAELMGWTALGVGVVLAVIASSLARQRRLGRASPIFAGWVLVAAHPGLWMSARSGDCGQGRVVASGVFTLLLVGIVIWARVRPSGPVEPEPAPLDGEE